MRQSRIYKLALTTQGPTYPPSELMNTDGDFVVIGRINRTIRQCARSDVGTTGVEIHNAHGTASEWGAAVVAADSPVPEFGGTLPYHIRRELDIANLSPDDEKMVLCTLPIPLPTNNYEVQFAPDQANDFCMRARPSYPLHATPLPDLRIEDGRQRRTPITLGEWIKAKGALQVSIEQDGCTALFELECSGLIPDSLYTIMTLRERDFNPEAPTRPGPLGIPNVMITDQDGNGRFHARLHNPFAEKDGVDGTPRNRVINVILLWMSYQMNHAGAIGLFGLGGDVHAQLKLPVPGFGEFLTCPKES